MISSGSTLSIGAGNDDGDDNGDDDDFDDVDDIGFGRRRLSSIAHLQVSLSSSAGNQHTISTSSMYVILVSVGTDASGAGLDVTISSIIFDLGMTSFSTAVKVDSPSSLTMSGCVIQNAGDGSKGIYSTGTAIVSQTIFQYFAFYTTGIDATPCAHKSITIRDSLFSNFTADASTSDGFPEGESNGIAYNGSFSGTSLSVLSSNFTSFRGTGLYVSSSMGGPIHIHGSRFTNMNNKGMAYGGAMLVGPGEGKANTTVDSCYFSSNTALKKGGAITFRGHGTAIVKNSFFVNNFSPLGGALATEDLDELIMQDTIFDGNRGTIYNSGNNEVELGGNGGTLALVGGSTTIIRCTFTNSVSARIGGVIFAEPDLLIIKSSTFDSASAISGGMLALFCGTTVIEQTSFKSGVASSYGGGIYLPASPPSFARDDPSIISISQTSFEGCESVLGGAGYIEANVATLIDQSDFVSCNASEAGGALYFADAAVSIKSSTFQACTTKETGGAIASVGGMMNMTNSSFISCEVSVKEVTSICLKLEMTDIFGDGWNGAQMYVVTKEYSSFLGARGLDLTQSLFEDDYEDGYINKTSTTVVRIEKNYTNVYLEEGFADVTTLCFDASVGSEYALLVTEPEGAYSFESDFSLKSEDGLTSYVEHGVFGRVYTFKPFGESDVCAGYGGGALHLSGGLIGSMRMCSFQGCRATNGNGGSLAVISSSVLVGEQTSLAIADSTFGSSVSTYYGSILYSAISPVAIENSQVLPAASLSSLTSDFFNSGGTMTCTSTCGFGYFGNCTAVDDCFSCLPGVCTACPAGTYLSSTGAVAASACASCAAGTVSSEGATSCSTCQAGAFATSSSDDSDGFGVASGGVACAICPAGRISEAKGRTECSACTFGYSSYSNGTTCYVCPRGTYAKLEGSSLCSNCAAGTIAHSTGSSACTTCTSPTTSESGSWACDECEVGSCFSHLG